MKGDVKEGGGHDEGGGGGRDITEDRTEVVRTLVTSRGVGVGVGLGAGAAWKEGQGNGGKRETNRARGHEKKEKGGTRKSGCAASMAYVGARGVSRCRGSLG